MTDHVLAYLCSSVSWGGLEMNQLRNANWMQERGHRVLILCKPGSPIQQSATAAGIKTVAIGDHKKYYDFRAGKLMAKLLDENAATHLILRDTRDISVAVIAKRKSARKIHLSYFTEMQLGVKKKNLLHTIRYKYIDLWSAPLNWLAGQVRTMTNFDHDRITVIPSGMDLRKFSLPMDQATAREKLGLPEETTIIGLSGRFDPAKGHLLLLEAFKLLNRQNTALCFLGEPNRENGMEFMETVNNRIESLGLKEQVYIRPFRQDNEVFYYAIDVFVMASAAETFGMVTIEAMAAGLPVIASNSGGSPEILGFGTLGRLFESGNTESLAGQIGRELDEPRTNTAEIRKSAEQYDHNAVCALVEQALNLV